MGSTFKIAGSSNPDDFMNSHCINHPIPGPGKARSTPRVDKIVEKIWNKTSPNKQPANEKPIEILYLDSSHSTDRNATKLITLEFTPNEDEPIVEAEPLITNQNETEEHQLELYLGHQSQGLL